MFCSIYHRIVCLVQFTNTIICEQKMRKTIMKKISVTEIFVLQLMAVAIGLLITIVVTYQFDQKMKYYDLQLEISEKIRNEVTLQLEIQNQYSRPKEK